MERAQVINLTAGPSTLPLPVLTEAAQGILNYEGTGMGITELSHRSPEFSKLTSDLASIIRKHLNLPDTHQVLFTQGGGSLQFSAVVLNLLARHRALYPNIPDSERVLDYVITGSWSAKAADEARRLAPTSTVNVVTDSRSLSSTGKSFQQVPPSDSWKFSSQPAYVYYCENETVDGVEFDGYSSNSTGVSFPFANLPRDPQIPSNPVPLIADYSSSFLSRPIPNIASHALVYAGAQKNIGPAGLTILIVRNDLLVDYSKTPGIVPIPVTLDYAVLAKNNSLYNTPPMFSMYVSLLVLRHFEKLGGIPYLQGLNARKAQKVYQALERRGESVFRPRVDDGSRSLMNVVFEVVGEGNEAKFIAEATKAGLRGVKGHRSVGGIRLSLYNAVTEEQVDRVVEFLNHFKQL